MQLVNTTAPHSLTQHRQDATDTPIIAHGFCPHFKSRIPCNRQHWDRECTQHGLPFRFFVIVNLVNIVPQSGNHNASLFLGSHTLTVFRNFLNALVSMGRMPCAPPRLKQQPGQLLHLSHCSTPITLVEPDSHMINSSLFQRLDVCTVAKHSRPAKG